MIAGADPGVVKWVNFPSPPPPSFSEPLSIMLMHRPQTPQPGFGSITGIITKIHPPGCRDGAVVRALASHQCGPGSIPELGVICGLTLLVLYSAPRGFSPGTPVFPSPQKPTFDLIYFHCSFQFTVSPISAPALERLDT